MSIATYQVREQLARDGFFPAQVEYFINARRCQLAGNWWVLGSRGEWIRE